MAQNWSSKKNLNFDRKHKIPHDQWEKLNRFHYLKFIFFDFLKVPYFCRINSRPIFYMSGSLYWPNHYKKTCFNVHEKLQRNPSVGSCIKIFIFRPYGFDYLGFLTNARRGAIGSKTQWVIYKDLDWWPGPQKVQFREITGYPEVVGLILALLKASIHTS